jgi:hypothetical protein
MALKHLTNPKNVEFPSQHHHEKWNRIGMVGVGFVSKNWDDLRRSHQRHCHRRCGEGLCGGRSVASVIVFVGWADLWQCNLSHHGRRVLTKQCEVFYMLCARKMSRDGTLLKHVWYYNIFYHCLSVLPRRLCVVIKGCQKVFMCHHLGHQKVFMCRQLGRQRYSSVVTWVITLLWGSSHGSLWGRHLGSQMSEKM